MEMKISRSEFVSALETVSGVVSTRPTLPILGNLLMDVRKKEIVISATDLEVGVVLTIAGQAKGEGKITVPAKKILDVMKEMPGDDVEMESDMAARLLIRAGEVEVKLLGLPPDEFPQLPEVKREAEVRVECSELAQMIRKTIYAVSSDETRYVLNGAYMVWEKNELKLVTTDGRRLAFISRKLKGTGGKGEAIVPTKALQELSKLLAGKEGDVVVTLGDGYAKFEAGPTVLTTRLIDGSFPDYEQVIPRNQDKRLNLETDAFLAAARRSALIAADRSSSVRLDIKKGMLALSAASHELGEVRENMAIKYEGEPVSVAYNARFLMDVLKNMESKEVHLELSTALAPGVLKPAGDESYICVVMPIRI